MNSNFIEIAIEFNNLKHILNSDKKKIFIAGAKGGYENCFALDKFIDLYGDYFDICFIKQYTPTKFLEKYPSISLESLIYLNDNIKKKSCILTTKWMEIPNIPGILGIYLSYFSPFNKPLYYTSNIEYKLNDEGCCFLMNFTNTDYYQLNITNKYLIGDIHIDNLLYKKRNFKTNFPKYDIVYFPNYISSGHQPALTGKPNEDNIQNTYYQNELENYYTYKESRIINNVLKKYSNKYSIVTLPHPAYHHKVLLNGIEYINPVFNKNNIEFLLNAKIVINSCKSFAGVCLTLNKPLIHLGCHLKTTVLPIFEDFLNIGSYNITEELTEENFEKCLIQALNDEKKELREQLVNKYAKEIYDPELESPTEKIKNIIDSLLK